MWNLSIEKFPKNTEKKIDYLNNHRIDEFYSFEKGCKENTNIERLSNVLIHSYIFDLAFIEEGFVNGFLVTSDNTKEDCIYNKGDISTLRLHMWNTHC